MVNRLIFFFLSLFMAIGVKAEQPVLQYFDGKNYDPVSWDNIDKIIFEDQKGLVILNHDGEKSYYPLKNGMLINSSITIPLIEITTQEYLEEIPDKENYQTGNFNLKSFDEHENIDTKVNIRGRGNTSWYNPKKPYRLKFDKKVSLCGLPAAKNYVLLANYSDASLVQNALAFKIGQMLELPYTNQYVPVDVKLNGIYKGSYLLTNKPGINAGSVDIDENNSIMWELDLAFDEDLKFISPLLNLPVMVADPELTQEQFKYWQDDFVKMEKAAIEMQAADLVDMDVLTRYVLVYEIMKNDELGWPKSMKLFKSKGGKYIFGPIWDFDTAMGKEWNGQNYTTSEISKPVWKNLLIAYLEDDPEYQKAIKRHWDNFKNNLPVLIDFIDDYAYLIETSAERNQTLWPDIENFHESIYKMKLWLKLRFICVDLLYSK